MTGVTVIAGWLQGPAGGLRSVSEIAASGRIWEPGHYERGFGREVLTPKIQAVGRIDCRYALIARPLSGSQVELVNGVHRWAIAVELGIPAVPVEMEPPRDDRESPVWTIEDFVY